MNQTQSNVNVMHKSQQAIQMTQDLENTKAELSAENEENKKLQKEKADMEADFKRKSKAEALG